MDWLKRMNTVLDYIEARLDGEINFNEIGLISLCPAGLFQRIFVNITGISLSDYIRRRRLTEAAFDIKTSDCKVIDIAIKYGYESADAFNVAFKRLHGITPTMARLPDIMIKSYPRLSFTLSIKGDIEMNYRIIEKESFKTLGKVIITSQESNQIPQFWTDCWKDGTVDTLLENGKSDPLLGICYNAKDDGTFCYMIGIETKDVSIEGMESTIIPASTWAVFESVGAMPHAIQNVWKRVFSEFLPSSKYKHAGTPDLELYYEGDSSKEDYRCEVWIPITKK